MGIKKEVVLEKRELVVSFDGKQVVFKLDEIPAELHGQLIMHGLSQKLGDSWAGAENATIAEANARHVFDQLKTGAWAAGRSGGGSDLIEALMRVFGKSREECSRVIASKDAAGLKELRKNGRIAAELLKIKAERAEQRAAGTEVESDGMEAELFGS